MRPSSTLSATLFAIWFAVASGAATAACPPDGTTRSQLSELRGAKWEVADKARREALALGLLDCLSHPDPALRDEIAFEALQSWMRNDQLGTATLDTIRTTLLARLKGQDAIGFAQPFAALVLAEVARADRRKPFLAPAERSAFVRESATWLAGVRDYRGYIEADGWRHGVAHGADLMLQLALNPAIDKSGQQAMLEAIAVQVLPAGPYFPHFYQFGEGERLMAPVFHLARRDSFSAAEWEAWFARLTGAARREGPVNMAWLARQHNLKAFLQPLYVSLAESQDAAQRARLLPIVTKALKQLD